MKRTKSMIYKETAESQDLEIYANNNSELFHNCIQYIEKNLTKKHAAGIYDIQKAIDAFYHAATLASNLYNKDYGYSFSVGDRFTVAVNMEQAFRADNLR